MQTVFAPANIAAKKNSEAVDLGNNSLISARIVDYKASAVRPLDEVKAQITAQLQRKLATELAAKAGAEKVAAVAAGNDSGLSFGATQKLLRQAPVANVNQSLSKQVFAADLSKGGAVVGGANDAGGYTVVKVLKVVDPEAATADKLKSLAQRLSGQSGGDLTNAYLGALKEHIKVEVKKGVAQTTDKDGKVGADAKKG